MQQVNKVYQTKHPRMRSCRNHVWDILENFFDEYSIMAIPREENTKADALAIAASTFKVPTTSQLKYEVEMLYRPSIPDNVLHWQIFEDDDQVKRFLKIVDEFSSTQIDSENQNLEVPKTPIVEELLEENLLNNIAGHKVLQLKSNFIPKGLIPLEKIFDKNDIPVKPTVKLEPANTCQYNLGTEENPQTINLSSLFLEDHVQSYLNLFQEYKGSFAWSYHELKTYDTSIVQHKIPLKEDAKPFAQRLRWFNPILLPVIEKEI